MRKERLIVPIAVVLVLGWAFAQYVAGLLLEREISRGLQDLEARGELVVDRTDVERGWLHSSGTIQVAPLLGDAWVLELRYEADHGVLSTRVAGSAMLQLGPQRRHVFGDILPSSPPRWNARYRTLGGTLEGSIQLAPFIVQQSDRELAFRGGRIAFDGQYGDWHLQASLTPTRLADGPTSLEIGPVTLESRYAYTDGAYHFTQHDVLRIAQLAWRAPELELDGRDLIVQSRMQLDERELRLQGELNLDEVRAAGEVLLTGGVTLELSRINADALRAVFAALRDEAARGDAARQGRELLARLEPDLIALFQDSPRLDITRVALDSPMLGMSVQGSGALFFDARDLGALSLLRLSEVAQRRRWLARLDGDFEWPNVPTVVALWLGLPLDTRDLTIDVVGGTIRVNGRPLPRRWRST